MRRQLFIGWLIGCLVVVGMPTVATGLPPDQRDEESAEADDEVSVDDKRANIRQELSKRKGQQVLAGVATGVGVGIAGLSAYGFYSLNSSLANSSGGGSALGLVGALIFYPLLGIAFMGGAGLTTAGVTGLAGSTKRVNELNDKLEKLQSQPVSFGVSPGPEGGWSVGVGLTF